jgi:hypothetical protein
MLCLGIDRRLEIKAAWQGEARLLSAWVGDLDFFFYELELRFPQRGKVFHRK